MYNFLDELSDNDISTIRKVCAMLYDCREHLAKTAEQEKMTAFDAFLDAPKQQYKTVARWLHPDKSAIPDAEAYFKCAGEYKNLPEEKQLIAYSAMRYLIHKEQPADSYADVFLKLGLDSPDFLKVASKELNSSEKQPENNTKSQPAIKTELPSEISQQQRKEKIAQEKLAREEKNALDRIVKNVSAEKLSQTFALLGHLKDIAEVSGFYFDLDDFLREPTDQNYYRIMLDKLNPADGVRLLGSEAYREAMDYYKDIVAAQEKLNSRQKEEENLAQQQPTKENLESLEQTKEDLKPLQASKDFFNRLTAYLPRDYKFFNVGDNDDIIAKSAIKDSEKNIADQSRILDVSNNRDEIELIYALLCDLDKTAKQGDPDVQRALDHFWEKPVCLESDDYLEAGTVYESYDTIDELIASKEADVKLGYGKAIDYYKKLVSSINNLNSKEKLSVQEEKTLETLQNIRKNIRGYARNPLEEQTDSGVTLSEVLEKTIKEVKKENVELQAILGIVDNDEKYFESTALLWHFPKTAEYSHLKSELDNFLKDPMKEVNYKKLIDAVAPNGKPVKNVAAAYLAAIDFYKNLAKTVHILEARKTNNRAYSSEAQKLRFLKQDKQQTANCINYKSDFILGAKTISARAIEVIEKQEALDIQQQKKPEQKSAMEAEPEPEPVLFSDSARASSPSIHLPVNPSVLTTKALEAEITDQNWADIKSKVDEAKSKDEKIQMSPNENKITVVKAQARINIERKEREVKVSSSSKDVDYLLLVKNYKITAAILGKEECCIDVSPPNATTIAELIIALDDGEPKIAPVINKQSILKTLKASAESLDPQGIKALKIYNKSLEDKANLAQSSAFEPH